MTKLINYRLKISRNLLFLIDYDSLSYIGCKLRHLLLYKLHSYLKIIKPWVGNVIYEFRDGISYNCGGNSFILLKLLHQKEVIFKKIPLRPFFYFSES